MLYFSIPQYYMEINNLNQFLVKNSIPTSVLLLIDMLLSYGVFFVVYPIRRWKPSKTIASSS